MWNEIWTQAEPAVANLLAVTILGVVAMLGVMVPVLLKRLGDRFAEAFEAKTNIQIEEKHKIDLHDAIDSGVAMVVSRIRDGLMEADKATSVQAVINHAKRSVGDAFEDLTPSQATLQTLIIGAFTKYGVQLQGTLQSPASIDIPAPTITPDTSGLTPVQLQRRRVKERAQARKDRGGAAT